MIDLGVKGLDRKNFDKSLSKGFLPLVTRDALVDGVRNAVSMEKRLTTFPLYLSPITPFGIFMH